MLLLGGSALVAYWFDLREIEVRKMIRPFDYAGITRDAGGIAHYSDRPNSLVEMLRTTVDKSPEHEAIVELGGQRVTYRHLWDRATRVAGGLKKSGIDRGDRVAIQLGNGLD